MSKERSQAPAGGAEQSGAEPSGGDEERPIAIIAALLANLGIAIAKFVAFLMTTSSSMLAESIHSLADTSNQGLMLFGRHRAKRRADEKHPFGFGQERYFWAFVVAIVLFALGAVFSMGEGYMKLTHPEPLSSPLWAIGVLVLAMIFEGISLATAVRQSRGDRRGSWWTYIRRTKSPENAVVLLEDSAAETGLVIALAGVGLTWLTGNPHFDAYGSFGVGLVLAFVAGVLAIEMKSLLIGEAAREEDVVDIRRAAQEEPRLEEIYDLRTMHLGPSDLLISAKVRLQGDLRFADVAETIDAIERRIRDRVPEARILDIEPDLG